MIYIKNLVSIYVLGLLVFGSCKTADVEPIINTSGTSLVKLSTNASNISEDNGLAQLTLTLNEQSSSPVTVFYKYTGTATYAIDYSASLSVTIAAGSLTSQTTILAIQDTLKEGNETLIITIDSVVGGKEDGNQSLQIIIEDDDNTSSAGNLIINEVLYDPGDAVADGDANGDGIRDPNQDEFLEFYNNSTKPLDMSGYKIFDATALSSNTPRHIVPPGTIIPAQKALVVFGGGTPTGQFGNAIVQTASSGSINMSNAGDLVTVQDKDGIVVVTFDITPLSDNPNESYSRSPDISGDFVQHAITPDGFKFSPGTKVDRKPF